MALFIQEALAQPLQRENGDMSCEQKMAKDIWFVIAECLTSDTDARSYQPCLKRIHSLACDENERQFFDWWWTFWNAANQKLPDMASSYVEELLSDYLDQQQLEASQLLPVSRNLSRNRPAAVSILVLDSLFQKSRTISCSIK